MKVLLAIDDDPARYSHLATRLADHEVVVACVQNPDAAEILLDSGHVFAVLLDHDMPCWTGTHYAREVLGPRNFPVCVTSANHPGAKAISHILSDMAVPHAVISITEAAPEERWMGWILDRLYRKDDSGIEARLAKAEKALAEIENELSGYDGERSYFELHRKPELVVELVRNYRIQSGG